MTKEEGKGKSIKKRAGNRAGNRPSAEEELSSKQLVEENAENMQSGTANDVGNNRGPGPPSKQLSPEELKKREKNIQRNKDYREKKKGEFTSLQEQLELYKEFCKQPGIAKKFNDFREKREEEKRIFSEELEKLGEAIEEDEANQHSDKGIQMILKNNSENLEMIQTGGPEGVTAMYSSSFGAMGTPFERAGELKRKREEELDEAGGGKMPATAYGTTPSCPPVGGFTAEAHLNYLLSTAALATQLQTREATHDKEASSSRAPPEVELRDFTDDELGLGSKVEVSVYNLVKQYWKLKDAERRQQDAVAASIDANCKFKEKKKEADNLNKQVNGLKEQFSKLKADLAEKGKISKDALELKMIDAVTLGWNLMKELLRSMDIGSEFLNLPLLDTIQLYPCLQNQFNEGLTLIGQGHPINDKVAIQSDNPPVVVPRSFFLYYNLLENAWTWEPDVSALLGDAANIAANGPQFQAADARANNVEQEDDANDQRMDEAS